MMNPKEDLNREIKRVQRTYQTPGKLTFALLLILSLIMLTVAAAGCSKRDKITAGIQYENAIMPLAKGNYWVYTDSLFNDTGLEEVKTAKIGITGSTKIAYAGTDRWVYHWNWYDMPENKPQYRKNLVSNEPDGLIYYGQKMGSSYTELNRRLFIKYPAEKDDEWVYTGGANIRCLSLSAHYETPAGVFTAIKYAMVLSGETQVLYYVPQVGYVGMERIVDGDLVLSRRLTEYKVRRE